MSLADEFLDTAKYLLRQGNNRPTDAAIRRSISTAYYALFHRLIESAIGRLVTELGQQYSLARSFDHGKMKQVCKAIVDGKSQFLGAALPDELKQLARTLVELQEQRHEADYSRAKSFTKADARVFVKRVETAFGFWETLQPNSIAGPFLLLLLVGEPKSR